MGTQGMSYPTDYMQTLATSRQKQWNTEAAASRAKIKDNSLRQEHFGDLGAFRAFGQVYMAARAIYLDTLKGVDEDLDAAAAGIVSSAKQMKDKDDEAGAAFIALRSRWANGMASRAQQVAASGSAQAQQAEGAQQQAKAETAEAPAAGAPAPGSAPAGGAPASGSAPAPAPAPGSAPAPGMHTPQIG